MSIKEIIFAIIFTPIILAEVWFALALGRVYEDQARCENGAIEFCLEEK